MQKTNSPNAAERERAYWTTMCRLAGVPQYVIDETHGVPHRLHHLCYVWTNSTEYKEAWTRTPKWNGEYGTDRNYRIWIERNAETYQQIIGG